MRQAGNFSSAACSQYQRRWMEAYGHDFAWVRCCTGMHLSPSAAIIPASCLVSRAGQVQN